MRDGVRAPRPVVRSENGLWAYERVLQRSGFPLVAGADEAGRGACAGPLVVAAAVLPPGRRGEVPGLADSKLLTEAAREQAYDEVVARALSWSVVVVPSDEVDRCGLHVMNVRAMRQAVLRLTPCPSYVLTDGFPIAGLPAPALAVWKGDRVAACVAAASVIAKVTRDRIMRELHGSLAGVRLRAPQGLHHARAHRGAERARSVPAAPPLVRQRQGSAAAVGWDHVGPGAHGGQRMSAEDLEKYETEMELQLYREYKDIVRQFDFVVETERRFYLANAVDVQPRTSDGEVWFELTLTDAWVWDMYRPGPLREVGARADVQGRQRREAREARPRDAGWSASVRGVGVPAWGSSRAGARTATAPTPTPTSAR